MSDLPCAFRMPSWHSVEHIMNRNETYSKTTMLKQCIYWHYIIIILNMHRFRLVHPVRVRVRVVMNHTTTRIALNVTDRSRLQSIHGFGHNITTTSKATNQPNMKYRQMITRSKYLLALLHLFNQISQK